MEKNSLTKREALRAMLTLFDRIAREGGAAYGLDSLTISAQRREAFTRLMNAGGFNIPKRFHLYRGLFSDALQRLPVES